MENLEAATFPQEEETTGELLTHVTVIFLQQGCWSKSSSHLDRAGVAHPTECLHPTQKFIAR
jgi:hypothetical protein